MGPYMRPIPVGASAAMLFSLLVAFVVSPWAALRLLRHYADRGGSGHHEAESWTTRVYRRLMNPLIERASYRWVFFATVAVLLLGAVAFIPLKWVQVKMLPFDNKSEFQVIIDMPDGTPLEQTARVAQSLGSYLGQQPEVINYEIYAGTSGPYNFNGLVRHYFLRNQPNQADIQVNLLSRHDRKAQSHEIARRLRPELDRIAAPFGARIKVAEVPPGPPVLQTLVAEVYGPDYKTANAHCRSKSSRFFSRRAAWWIPIGMWKIRKRNTKCSVDLDKAALQGISAADVSRTVQLGSERNLRGFAARSDFRAKTFPSKYGWRGADGPAWKIYRTMKLPGPSGGQVSLREVTRITQDDASIRASTARICDRWCTSQAMWRAKSRVRCTRFSR